MLNKISRNITTFPTSLHNLQPYQKGVGVRWNQLVCGVRWNQLVCSVSRHLARRFCKEGNMDDAPDKQIVVGHPMTIVDLPKGGH
jgi:hypothetical protein